MLIHCWTEHRLLRTFVFLSHFKKKKIESVYLHQQTFRHFVYTLMRSAQSHKHYIYARCCPGQVGRWNLIVARGLLKPLYFAFVETMSFFFSQTTHFVPWLQRSLLKIPKMNKPCLRLILKALSPRHFDPRWPGFRANISIDKKKIFSGTQGTHFVKSRAHSPRSTSKIISMIAFRRTRPCGERPCKSLVQRSRILTQKRPLLRFGGLEITLVWFSPLFTFHVLVAYGGPRGYI